jgi:hypothetical protein
VSLSLEPGLEITGRLTDASGEPAAGVTVYAERRVRRGKRSAMADQDGRFRIAGLASGEWLLTARAGAAEAERVASAGSHEVLLVLRGDSSVPAAVQIRVVGHDGGEVTQAALGWKSPTQSGSGLWAPGKEIELYGDDGAAGLEIEVVNPRDAAGLPLPYGPGRAGPLERRDREIEVTLPAGLSATGRVSVPAGGDAGGLSVVAAAPSTLTDAPIVIGEATTRPDGTFDVPTGGDADVALAVRANSGARVGLVSPVGARPGGEPVVLPLVRRADVTLTVLTTEGRPADGVLVTVVRRVLTDEPEEHRARADEQGVAVLGALVPGAAYALQIQGEDPGSAALALDPWLAEDGTLRLEARLHVTGLVRDDVGAPYPRAFILLRVDGQWAGFSIADDAGRFAMEVGSDARLDVLALPPFDPWNNGFCEWELGSKPAPARAGDPVSLVVSRGASVEYRLDARRPESWAGAHMVLTRVDGKTSPEVPHGGRVPLSPSGRGRLPPLVGGARYTLFLPEGESGHCALLSFVATEGGLARLVHAEAGAVTGRVRGAPEGIPIRVRAPFQEQAAAARVAADGSFAVGGLPIGIRVELEATAGGDGQSWVGSVVAEPGDDVLMDLVSAGIPGVGPR